MPAAAKAINATQVDVRKVLEIWVKNRQRARTDLLWLCNDVLQYRDVERAVHGPIIDALQQFPGGKDEINWATGQHLGYKPAVDLWRLDGKRRSLFLDPRGHLKTTVITIAHTIQWIVNYPDIRILLSMATGDQVTRVMQEILSHFRYNDRFRWLFPEYVPAKNPKDFGNNDGFTVPCRRTHRKEPTVSSISVGKTIASGHYEVIKHSDLVDKENVKTPNQIAEVISHAKHTNPLLERGEAREGREETSGWFDVEGTRYDFSDYYGAIIDGEEKLPEEKRRWQIHVRGAENEDGSTLWPKKFPKSELDAIRNEIGDYIYSCQYLNKPIPTGSGLCGRDDIVWVRPDIMKLLLDGHLPRLHVTVDLAGMETERQTGDFTVFCVAGFDRDGRMRVVEIRCGRMNIDETIATCFQLYEQYPKIADFKVEKEAHSRVWGAFLKREITKYAHRTGKWLPPILDIKRDSRTSKKHRIRGLQPWFQSKIITFAETIPCRLELVQQITRFSDTSTYHDDILDALADQMQNRDGEPTSDVLPDAPKGAGPNVPLAVSGRFLGFDPFGRPTWQGDTSGQLHYDSRLGL